MKIDRELIEHVAATARLKLAENEIKEFLPQLKEVLESFSRLDETDTKDVESSFQPVELREFMREDIARKCLTNDEALSLTEHKKDGYFKGPRAV